MLFPSPQFETLPRPISYPLVSNPLTSRCGLLEQPRIPISSTVHIFDLPTGQWSAVEAAKGPTPRVGHTAVACGPAGSEKIYIFGGRNGIALGDGAPPLTDLVSG